MKMNPTIGGPKDEPFNFKREQSRNPSRSVNGSLSWRSRTGLAKRCLNLVGRDTFCPLDYKMTPPNIEGGP
jgi:hypothetical protein